MGGPWAATSRLAAFSSAKVLLDYKGVQDALHTLLGPAIDAGWIDCPLSEEKIGLIAGIVIFFVSLLLLGQRRPLAHLEAEGESTMHHLLTEMEAGSKAAPRVRDTVGVGALPRDQGRHGV